MNYQQMQDIKDLLERCYINILNANGTVELKNEIKTKIQEIKKDMADYDLHISQLEEEAKYGNFD